MNHQKNLEDNKDDWIKMVKRGNSKALELLYRAYRQDFVTWICKTTSCERHMAVDIFQESALVIYKNAKAGRLDNLKSSIKTYLFAVGKRVYLFLQRKQKVAMESLEMENIPLEKLLILPKEPDLMNKRQKMVSKLLTKMRYPCREILLLYYYRGFDLKEITEELEYKNVNVIKVLKFRCMNTLRKAVMQHLN